MKTHIVWFKSDNLDSKKMAVVRSVLFWNQPVPELNGHFIVAFSHRIQQNWFFFRFHLIRFYLNELHIKNHTWKMAPCNILHGNITRKLRTNDKKNRTNTENIFVFLFSWQLDKAIIIWIVIMTFVSNPKNHFL